MPRAGRKRQRGAERVAHEDAGDGGLVELRAPEGRGRAPLEAWIDAPTHAARSALAAHRTGPHRLIRAVAGLVLDPDDRPVTGERLPERAAGLLFLAAPSAVGLEGALAAAAAVIATRALAEP